METEATWESMLIAVFREAASQNGFFTILPSSKQGSMETEARIPI
jgi:hypothetical protein